MNNNFEERYNKLIGEYDSIIDDIKKNESKLNKMMKNSDDLSILIKSGDFIDKMGHIRLNFQNLENIKLEFQQLDRDIMVEINKLCSYDESNLDMNAAIDKLNNVIVSTPSTSPVLDTLKQNFVIATHLNKMLQILFGLRSCMPKLEHYMKEVNGQYVYYDFVKSFFSDKITDFQEKYNDSLYEILGLCNGDESIKKLDDRYKSMWDAIASNSDIGMINRIDRWMADVDIECARFYNLESCVKRLCMQNPGLEFACPFKYQDIGENIIFCSDISSIISSTTGISVLDRSSDRVRVSDAGKIYSILPVTKVKRSFVNGHITMKYNNQTIYLESLMKCAKTRDGSQYEFGMLQGKIPRDLKRKYALEGQKTQFDNREKACHEKNINSERATLLVNDSRCVLGKRDKSLSELPFLDRIDEELANMIVDKDLSVPSKGVSMVTSKFLASTKLGSLIDKKMKEHKLKVQPRKEKYYSYVDDINSAFDKSIENKRK